MGSPFLRYSAYFNLLPNGNNEVNGIEFRMANRGMARVCSDKSQGYCYLNLRKKDGSWISLYSEEACTGEWVYASYLMEFCDGQNFIREAQIGSIVTNLDNFESFMTGYPDMIDLKAYMPTHTNVAVKVDSLSITAIPEPVFAGLLSIAAGLFLVKRKMNY